MEPGVARVAVAGNMYQTAARCNLKTLSNEISYLTTQPKDDQPQDPNLKSKLNAKENW